MLDPEETVLYGDLIAGAFGPSVRLEQERVSFATIEPCAVTPPGRIPFRIRGRKDTTEVRDMRHRIGIILAVIMAGVLFFPGSWGYLRLLRLPAPAGQLSGLPAGGGSLISNHHVLLALAALAGTGLLAGILSAVPRISPLAAGLPGLLLLGWTGLYLATVRQGVDLIPLRSDPFGAGFEAMLSNGILGAAGLAMIVPMFVPSRWRARPGEPTGDGGLIETTAGPELEDQPTMQLTPIRANSLVPLPPSPWHEAGAPDNPSASGDAGMP
jgi:hypothetical protein